MSASQHYSLRWNNYLRHITFAFDNLRNQDEFVDVTLCCDGRKIKAHKMLLSACSGYFKDIFKENPHPHPVIIFKFIKYDDLNAIIEFMYQGEVNIQQDALQSFLQTAELLAVQGLTSEEKPKSNKTDDLEQDTLEEQIVKSIPSAITTVTDSSQHSSVELQSNVTSIVKKRKIIFSDDEENLYTETVSYPKEDQSTDKDSDIQYIPGSVKMDIPEYLNVTEEHSLSDTNQAKNTDKSNENTTQTSGQFTSEYEILAESEIDDKFQPRSSTEFTEINTVAMDADHHPNELLKCKFCDRILQSISAYKRHNASRHGQHLRKHECNLCKKQFKTKWSLSTHTSRFHRENRIVHESIFMNSTF